MEIAIGLIGVVIAAISLYVTYLQLKRARERDSTTGPSEIVPNPKPPHSKAPFFIERTDETGHSLVRATQAALKAHGLVVLWGAGGTGKTTLALRTAHRSLDSLDGVVWVTLESYEEFRLSKLLNEICIQLDREDVLTLALDARRSLARSLLAKGEYLVAIDGFEAAEEKESILCFLRQLPCMVLITSRRYLYDVHCIRIGPLSKREASEFVRALIRQSPELSQRADVNSTRIAQAARSNPMAIRWILAQLMVAAHPDEALAALRGGKGRVASRIFGRSFSLLDDTSQRVLLGLSLFRDGASRAALGRVSGVSGTNELNRALMDCRQLAFIDAPIQPSRLRIAGLTRTLARAELQRDDRRKSIQLGFVSHFLEYCETFNEGSSRCLDALQTEKENIMAAIAQAGALSHWPKVIRFWECLSLCLWVRGFWDDYVRCDQWALKAAEKLEDNQTRAVVLSELGWVAVERAKYRRGVELIREAYDVFLELDQQEWVCIALAYLTVAELRRGNLDEAERHCRQALTIAETEGYQGRTGVLRTYLGSVFRERGLLDEARGQYEAALTVHQEADDDKHLMATLFNMGNLEFEEGNLNDARTVYRRATEIARELGQKDMIAGLKYRLAKVKQQAGDYQSALRLASQAEQLFQELKKGKDRALAESLVDQIKNQIDER